MNCTGYTLAFVRSLTLSQTTNLDSSKLKEFAEDKFKVGENGGKSSERIENTVGKGEIACYLLKMAESFPNR